VLRVHDVRETTDACGSGARWRRLDERRAGRAHPRPGASGTTASARRAGLGQRFVVDLDIELHEALATSTDELVDTVI
jgi:hypothetical protein